MLGSCLEQRWQAQLTHMPAATLEELRISPKWTIQVSPPSLCRTGCLELATLPLKTKAWLLGKGGAEEPSPHSVLPPPTHRGVNIPWQTLQSKQGHQCPARLSCSTKGNNDHFFQEGPFPWPGSSVARCQGGFTWLASPRNLGSEHPQGLWHSRLVLKSICGHP